MYVSYISHIVDRQRERSVKTLCSPHIAHFPRNVARLLSVEFQTTPYLVTRARKWKYFIIMSKNRTYNVDATMTSIYKLKQILVLLFTRKKSYYWIYII